jgi:hypothetical protein
MQHIGLELKGEREREIERSNINFASVISALWKIDDFKNVFPFLSGVDPYGDTYFNVHQAPRVITELEKLKQENAAAEVLNEIQDTIKFLQKVEQHTFAKFIGD